MDAFKKAYERLYAPLCIMAARYTESAEVAEEIVQDIFLKLSVNHKEIHIDGSIVKYLSAAVRKDSINYLKHKLVERKYNLARTAQLQRAVLYLQLSNDYGSSILIAKELEDKFKDAVTLLPEKCREIFLLHRQEGLSYAQIALKLSLSKNTVQRQMSIAISKLKEKLAHHIS
jgi:RNA polymerase sigma-70 factor, ECF subfamily